MEETLRSLVAIAFALLLVMLRLDAERFGVAEYTAAAAGDRWTVLGRRFAWFVLGLALIGIVAVIHPGPPGALGLQFGDRGAVLLLGLAYATLGAAQAIAVARLRFGRLRTSRPSSYPWPLLNALATALVDEAAFRGIILGLLLVTGLDAGVAIVIQALVYTLATRTGVPGRDLYLLACALGLGLAGGWLTVETGGIGAAVVGHVATRFAVAVLLERADGDETGDRDDADEPDEPDEPEGGPAVTGAPGRR